MKSLKQIKVNFFIAAFLGACFGLTAQEKIVKLEKSYPANDDISVILDARHTNIIFETWNKDKIEIKAFLETKNADNKKRLLENWELDVTANKEEVHISSGGVMGMPPMPAMPPMEGMMEMMEPLMEGLVIPIVEGVSEHPLPPELYENLGSLNFDYEAYEKEGEEYLKKWEQEVEQKFGKKFEAKMEAWGEKFAEDSEKWSEEVEKNMEEWEKKYEVEMEAWNKEFEKKMEVWGEQFGKQMAASFSGETLPLGAGKRTIIIKMPKDAVLKLDVRHGEVKLANISTNIKAQLSHSNLMAETIGGAKTSIMASYTPLNIKTWNYGVLNTNYVKQCHIEEVKSIKLNSNTSDVTIGKLSEMGLISGTFGKLIINELDPDFEMLRITLNNSNLVLDIPDSAINFRYTGSQSDLQHPKTLQAKSSKQYDTETLNGFFKSKNSNSSIAIEANLSDVILK